MQERSGRTSVPPKVAVQVASRLRSGRPVTPPSRPVPPAPVPPPPPVTRAEPSPRPAYAGERESTNGRWVLLLILIVLLAGLAYYQYQQDARSRADDAVDTTLTETPELPADAAATIEDSAGTDTETPETETAVTEVPESDTGTEESVKSVDPEATGSPVVTTEDAPESSLSAPVVDWQGVSGAILAQFETLKAAQSEIRTLVDEQKTELGSIVKGMDVLEGYRTKFDDIQAAITAMEAREPEAPKLELPPAIVRNIRDVASIMENFNATLQEQKTAIEALSARMKGIDAIAGTLDDIRDNLANDVRSADGAAPVLSDELTSYLKQLEQTVTAVRSDLESQQGALGTLSDRITDLGRLPTNILRVSGVMSKQPTAILYRTRVELYPAKDVPPEPAPAPEVKEAEPEEDVFVSGPGIYSPSAFYGGESPQIGEPMLRSPSSMQIDTDPDRKAFSPSDFRMQ